MVNNAIRVYDDLLEDRFKQMRRITGLTNPNSTTTILPWLKERGYPYDDCQKGHIKRAFEFFENPPDKWSKKKQEEYAQQIELQRVLELRLESAKSSPKKYKKLRQLVDVDSGVLRNSFQFAGAGRTWRWSGRGFQTQNLSKPTKELEKILATVVKSLEFLDAKTIEMIFEQPFDVLSSCVRPTIQAPDGYIFADVDLSAIENRVLGWMSKCEAILEVFEKGQDPYIAFATKLFHRTYEELWHEYKVLGNSSKRTIAKPGVLGAGYMLGAGEQHENRKTGEMEATGLLGYAWNMGVRQFTQQDSVLSVETFREAYKEVKTFWYAIDNAARKCISTNREVDCWPITFDMKGPFMRMRLPSGRYLHYFRPRIMDWKTPWGEIRPTVTYEGLNDKKIWARMSTHPGKLTENCWNFDTLILTDSGVKAITEVTRTDLVWDGTTWVNHGGVSYSGERETVDFSGAKVTPEHKVETRWGWKRISEVSPDEATSAFHRHYGDSTWEALCGSAAWVGSGEGDMAPPVRLRIGNGDGRIRVSQRAVSILRVFQIRDNLEKVKDPRNVEASGVCGMAVDVSAVSKCKTSSLQKLRWAWNRCVQSVGEVRVFLGRYGRDVQNRFVHRAGEQQQGVLQDELRLGESKNAMQEQAFQPHHRHTQREDDDCRSIRVVGGREDDAFISEQRGLPKESDVRSTGCVEPVYDILNCGPRSAFTVVLPDGRLILSHNCDQAISRDLLVHGMRLAHTEGLSIRIHVHDQLVALVRESEADRQLQILKECMQAQPSWAKGLPLGSNGFLSRIFTKD